MAGSGSGRWGAGLGCVGATLGQEGLDEDAVGASLVEKAGCGSGSALIRGEVAGSGERLAGRTRAFPARRRGPLVVGLGVGIDGIRLGLVSVIAVPMGTGAGPALHADMDMGQGVHAGQEGRGEDEDEAEEAGNPSQDVARERHAGMLGGMP